MSSQFFRKHILLSPKKFKNNYSYLFDGVNEVINIDSVYTALATTTKGTWSCWVKPVDATPAASSAIISFGDTNANERIMFFMTTGGIFDCFITIAGVSQWGVDTDAAVFADNTWTHLVVVQDGISPVLYVDGSAVAQTFYISTNTTRWFNDGTGLDNGRIGNVTFNNLNTNYFNGNIDEVGFFNTNLTAQQITEIYNNGKPKNLLKHSAVSNLVSYFRMGDGDTWDGTNWTLIDKKGTNNGTSVNLEFADNELDTI